MNRLACSIIIATSVITLTTSAAMAEEGGSGFADRDGFMLGFGINFGEISCAGRGCDDVTEAAGIDFHLGSMISPRMGIDVEIWAMGHTEENLTLTHTIATLGVQYWLLPRLWIKGGVGVAQAAWQYDGLINLEDQTKRVPAIMGAVGYELVVGKSFALDVQLRGGVGFYGDADDGTDIEARNLGIGAGFTWF